MVKGYGPNRKRLDIFTAKAMQGLLAGNPGLAQDPTALGNLAATVAADAMKAADLKHADLAQAELDADTIFENEAADLAPSAGADTPGIVS